MFDLAWRIPRTVSRAVEILFWLILLAAAAYWYGRWYEREAHHADMFCQAPSSRLDAVLIFLDEHGAVRCERKMNPYKEWERVKRER